MREWATTARQKGAVGQDGDDDFWGEGGEVSSEIFWKRFGGFAGVVRTVGCVYLEC